MVAVNAMIVVILNVINMTIQDYQKIIALTAIYPKEIGLAYCALGLTGEAGEVAEKIKKLYRDGLGSDHTYKEWGLLKDTEDPDIINFKNNLKKEIGDVLWYCTALAHELGLDLEDIMQTNYDKLIKRRETNTLHGNGDNREEHESK